MEWTHVTNYLTGADQKIPDWLAKTAFLREVEASVRLGIKPWFCGVA